MTRLKLSDNDLSDTLLAVARYTVGLVNAHRESEKHWFDLYKKYEDEIKRRAGKKSLSLRRVR